MLPDNEIFICEHGGETRNYRLYAVLDELTLTYRVIQRAPDGGTRSIRQHIPSLGVIFVVLAVTVVASLLKSRRTPEARAHAGTLREPREAREVRRRQDT